MPRRSAKNEEIYEALFEQLKKHEAEGTLPTSHRFLFYELVMLAIIEKHSDSGRPDSPSNTQLIRLREEGRVPWDWIIDETRSLENFTGYVSVRAGLLAKLRFTELDPWAPRRAPLILCESRSLAGGLRNLAREYRVFLAATNGQCGGFLHTDVAPALVPRQRVIYLGDLDLVGNDIEYNTRSVLQKAVGGRLAWLRIALTEQQVLAYQLPKILKGDQRFLGDGGVHEAVETEALSQLVITRIVRDALDALLPAALDEVLAREEAQREALETELRALAPELLAEEEETETEEPDLPPALIAVAKQMEADHIERQEKGKLRRGLKRE
jgi:hypothetical protein